MLKKIIIPLSFLYFLCAGAMAQRVTISGTVTDFDNKPLDFVNVGVKGSSNGTMTNGKGQYALKTSVADSVTIVFSYMGYQTVEKRFDRLSGDVKYDLMMREDVHVIEGIEVITRRPQTNTVTSIDPKSARLNADPAGGGIESTIKSQMGVSGGTGGELSSQYSVRGGSYDENIVYVNGIEVYRPLLIRSGQQEGLSFINPNMTESVGFSSGGYDAHYGDKMASVLDITYKKPSRFEASATASLMGANAYVGSTSKGFSQITGVRYKTAKILLGTMDTDAEYDPSFLDAQTYLTYNIKGGWEVSFLGNLSRNEYKFVPQTRETRFGTISDAKNFKVYFDGWEQDKFLTSFGAATLKGRVKENLQVGLTASAFQSDEKERYDISGEYELTDVNLNAGGGQGESGTFMGVGTYFEHARNSLNVNVMNVSHFGTLSLDKHDIRWGLTLQKEQIDDKIKEWELRDSAGYSMPNNGEIVSVYSSLKSDNSVKSTRFSAYLMDTYRFLAANGQFTLTAGVRASHWSFNKELIISPRASIAYVPESGKNFTLRFATGVYYQSPFYKEFQKTEQDEYGNSYIVLNNNIKSQKSIHFVLGGDYDFQAMNKRSFKFTSELYYKKLSDLIPYTVDNVKIRYMGENVGTGYVMGWDMKLFGEFIEGTDNWISLSFMKANQNINGVNLPLPTDQRYNLSVFFQDYFMGSTRLRANIQGHLAGGLPTSAPHTGYDKTSFRTSAYRRLDIGFSWELLGESYAIRSRSAFAGAFKNVWLGLDVFNLFDIKNTNSYYWVTDIFNKQYAVPNYLTGRQLNFKIIADF